MRGSSTSADTSSQYARVAAARQDMAEEAPAAGAAPKRLAIGGAGGFAADAPPPFTVAKRHALVVFTGPAPALAAALFGLPCVQVLHSLGRAAIVSRRQDLAQASQQLAVAMRETAAVEFDVVAAGSGVEPLQAA